MRRSDYEVFIDKFKPEMIQDNGIKFYETYGEEYETIRNENVYNIWTLLDGGTGKTYISPGRRYVNRVNYIITKVPWKAGQRDYYYG